MPQITETVYVYVGTYTSGQSQGIYVYRLDPSSGALSPVSQATGIQHPSFLAIEPRRPCLYSVSEVAESGGKPTGAVSAFAIDPRTGGLTFLNHQSSGGRGPCHLCVERTGRYVLVANYSGGSVAMLPIEPDGRLAGASDFVQHQGGSVDPRRQEGPHAHSIQVDPGNRYAFAADLGLDKVLVYRLDLAKGKLRPNDEPWASVKPGAGPRHFDFHPSASFAYLINEMGNTVTAFRYEAARGVLREVQMVSTLPADFSATSHCADIHVAPSGRFVYGSNRGHDSIAVFAIDPATGRLNSLGQESTRGKTPRNFGIDPTGTFLLAANQDTNSIVTFRIDAETGRLAATGSAAEVPTPVCVQFLPLRT
ncbi:MAG: lactonase family protein [Planctomycetes bacterium]|nr:lactonase family protein [Planctomycetota bacterium]